MSVSIIMSSKNAEEWSNETNKIYLCIPCMFELENWEKLTTIAAYP